MKKITVLLAMLFSYTINASAQSQFGFHHCSDDSFPVVSLEKETGTLTIVIKTMNPPVDEKLYELNHSKVSLS